MRCPECKWPMGLAREEKGIRVWRCEKCKREKRGVTKGEILMSWRVPVKLQEKAVLLLALFALAMPVQAQTVASTVQANAAIPTLTGTNTFTGCNFWTQPVPCDPINVNGSMNVSDIVANGNGTTCTTAGQLCTGYRVQAHNTNTDSFSARRMYIGGWSDDPANRSAVQEYWPAGDGVSSKQYFFLNGHLGTGSTFATPVVTSANVPAFGLESTDTTSAIIATASGSNQAIDRPVQVAASTLTLGSSIRPATVLSLPEPLPTCSATTRGAVIYDTTLAQPQLCVCTVVSATNKWCVMSNPACTGATSPTTTCQTS